jgi:hypothetical protein
MVRRRLQPKCNDPHPGRAGVAQMLGAFATTTIDFDGSGVQPRTCPIFSTPVQHAGTSPTLPAPEGDSLGTQLSGVIASIRCRTSDVFTPRAPSTTGAGSGGWTVRIWASTGQAVSWSFRGWVRPHSPVQRESGEEVRWRLD